MLSIRPDEPLAIAVTEAIHTGNVDALIQMLREHPQLATARIGDKDDRACGAMSRTLLHVATDWPGHFPNGAATVAALVDAGADVNARFTGPHTETPLHWAASSDDVEVLDALLDGGADIEAAGAVIAGGTPLSDAVAFGQWNAARRLVARGATTPLREAAALGLLDRVERRSSEAVPPTPDQITQAFWYACHGGQQHVAAYLLERGAQLNWVSRWDHTTPLDAAQRSGHEQLVEWLRTCGATSAGEPR
jgi:ankyrin repeat protein